MILDSAMVGVFVLCCRVVYDVYREHQLERSDGFQLMQLLHRSNAWHCGCSKCVGRPVLGERVKVSEAEWKALDSLRNK